MHLLEKLDELGYLSDANGIWNLDESPFKLAELHDVVYSRKGVREVATFAECSDREQVTVLAGGNAAGFMLRPLILFGGVCHVASRITGTDDKCFVGVNNSGTMDYVVWNEYFLKELLSSLSAPKVCLKMMFVFSHTR